jgi:hypothetical protein
LVGASSLPDATNNSHRSNESFSVYLVHVQRLRNLGRLANLVPSGFDAQGATSSASMIAEPEPAPLCHTREITISVLCVAVYCLPQASISARHLPKGCVTMFDMMVDAVLFFGFPLGVLVGYEWRDRISRERRARYVAERGSAKIRSPRRGDDLL